MALLYPPQAIDQVDHTHTHDAGTDWGDWGDWSDWSHQGLRLLFG